MCSLRLPDLSRTASISCEESGNERSCLKNCRPVKSASRIVGRNTFAQAVASSGLVAVGSCLLALATLQLVTVPGEVLLGLKDWLWR